MINKNPSLFNTQITAAIQSNTVYAVSDASMKYQQIGEHWIITNKEKTTELKNTLYHKCWNDNTCKGVEAIVLLELIEVIERKGWHISSRKITVGVDNRKVYQTIMEDVSKANEYVQDRGAELA